MVAIIDYGMGNVASVQKALNFLNVKSIITGDSSIIKKAEKILLPGVGSFAQGMENLRKRELDKILTEEIIDKEKKFLGICLGMQLIMESGSEPLDCEGLGWIKGKVVKFQDESLNIPHMGWNDIKVYNNTYYKNCISKDFYFIHSYHVVPDNAKDIAATVDYGFEVVASVQSDNIFATQFHPEKSQDAGLSVLKAFFNQDAES